MGFDLTLLDRFGGGVLATKEAEGRSISVFIPCGTIASISFDKESLSQFMEASSHDDKPSTKSYAGPEGVTTENPLEKKKPGPRPKISHHQV
jgi:hypothetical protein